MAANAVDLVGNATAPPGAADAASAPVDTAASNAAPAEITTAANGISASNPLMRSATPPPALQASTAIPVANADTDTDTDADADAPLRAGAPAVQPGAEGPVGMRPLEHTHRAARVRLTDLTEALLAAVLSCSVLGLQDAMHAARSCRALHGAVQRCEEMWMRLHEEHFGAGSSGGGGGGDAGAVAGGTVASGGAGNAASAGRGGGGSGRAGGPSPVATAVGLSRQASMVAMPDPPMAAAPAGLDGTARRTAASGARSASPAGGAGGSEGVGVRVGAAAGLSVLPASASRVGTMAAVPGGARMASGSGGGCASAAAGPSAAGGSRDGGAGGPTGGAGGGGSGDVRSWRERFKARYTRESSERRHRRRVALYRMQAAVQEARADLAAARRRIGEEAARLEQLGQQISELERARQAGAAGPYWMPAAVQQHFSRVVTHGSAVDAASRLQSLRQELLLCRQNLAALQRSLPARTGRLQHAERDLRAMQGA